MNPEDVPHVYVQKKDLNGLVWGQFVFRSKKKALSLLSSSPVLYFNSTDLRVLYSMYPIFFFFANIISGHQSLLSTLYLEDSQRELSEEREVQGRPEEEEGRGPNIQEEVGEEDEEAGEEGEAAGGKRGGDLRHQHRLQLR